MNSLVAEKKKFTQYQVLLWVGIGSILMAFAGLTSAYIVKKGQANWLDFDLPSVFWISTVVILVSSFTMQMAAKKHKEGQQNQFNGFMTVTAILGISFLILQLQGFAALEANSIALTGPKSNSAGSFLLVITGFHMLHLLAGVIALVIISIKAPKQGESVSLMSTYWHFVDVLWIYLFVFLNWVG
jgi:cytochrome c oxidase subunit 3